MERGVGIAQHDRVATMFDDGRAFVVRRHGNVDLLTPETGEFDSIVGQDGRRMRVGRLRDAGGFGVGGVPMRTPEGARIFLVDGVPARFDVRAFRLVSVGFSAHDPLVVLGCTDERTVYVRVGDWGIARARFGTGDGFGLIYRER